MGDDWRLSSALNQDGSGPDSGYNVTGSEMGHLYYTELGNPPEGPISKTEPFINFPAQPDVPAGNLYYSSTYYPCPGGSYEGWFFCFYEGWQNHGSIHNSQWTFAVRDGDVAPVPIPSTCVLLLFGLLGMAGIKKEFS